MIVKEISTTAPLANTEAKFQFYKEVTTKDPVTNANITMNVVDGVPITKSALTAQIAALTAKLNAINDLA